MTGTSKMTNRKIDDSVIDAEDIIGLGLLKNHTHFIMGEIDDENVEKAIRWLLYENMDNSNPDKVLTIYINSTGGSLTDAFGLIDVMQNSSFVVRTIGIGNIMSSAFLIFAAGDKGERYIAKNTSIMCHQFTESIDEKYHDMMRDFVQINTYTLVSTIYNYMRDLMDKEIEKRYNEERGFNFLVQPLRPKE